MVASVLVCLALASSSRAADEPVPPAVDASIARALVFLSRQQQPDGAFTAPEEGGPRLASTAVATLAILSAGQTGATGRYGLAARRGVAFLVRRIPEDGNVGRAEGSGLIGHAQVAVALAEAYGAADDVSDRAALRTSLGAMLGVILNAQDPRPQPGRGGWNADGKPGDGELVATAWCVLALRAMQDAGLAVPKDRLARAASFVAACYRQDQHQFADRTNAGSPVLAGAALLCMEFSDPAARPPEAVYAKLQSDALKLMVEKRIPDDVPDPYAAGYLMSLAAHLSPDPAAGNAVKALRDPLLARQAEDGSWPPPRAVAPLGAAGATALGVLSVSPSYHLLPLYQR